MSEADLKRRLEEATRTDIADDAPEPSTETLEHSRRRFWQGTAGILKRENVDLKKKVDVENAFVWRLLKQVKDLKRRLEGAHVHQCKCRYWDNDKNRCVWTDPDCLILRLPHVPNCVCGHKGDYGERTEDLRCLALRESTTNRNESNPNT